VVSNRARRRRTIHETEIECRSSRAAAARKDRVAARAVAADRIVVEVVAVVAVAEVAAVQAAVTRSDPAHRAAATPNVRADHRLRVAARAAAGIRSMVAGRAAEIRSTAAVTRNAAAHRVVRADLAADVPKAVVTPVARHPVARHKVDMAPTDVRAARIAAVLRADRNAAAEAGVPMATGVQTVDTASRPVA
jgi:hypothetical protein